MDDLKAKAVKISSNEPHRKSQSKGKPFEKIIYFLARAKPRPNNPPASKTPAPATAAPFIISRSSCFFTYSWKKRKKGRGKLLKIVN